MSNTESKKNTIAMDFINHVVTRCGSHENNDAGDHTAWQWDISKFGGEKLSKENSRYVQDPDDIWRFEDGSAVLLSGDPSIIENTPAISVTLIILTDYVKGQKPPHRGVFGIAENARFASGMCDVPGGYFNNGEYTPPAALRNPPFAAEEPASNEKFAQASDYADDHGKAVEYLLTRTHDVEKLMRQLDWKYNSVTTLRADIYGVYVVIELKPYSLTKRPVWGMLFPKDGEPVYFETHSCFAAYMLARYW